MIRQLLIATCLLSLAAIGTAKATDSRTVTITIENDTPSITVVPSIEVFGSAPTLFTNTSLNQPRR
jgi:hypothetical protein